MNLRSHRRHQHEIKFRIGKNYTLLLNESPTDRKSKQFKHPSINGKEMITIFQPILNDQNQQRRQLDFDVMSYSNSLFSQ